MPDITITISANTAAWYAAIVATLALIMSGITAWRDRARIKVVARAGYRVTGGGGYNPNKDYILFTICNKGRRPRTIEKVGWATRQGIPKNFITSDSIHRLPQELTEGRSCTYMAEQEGVDFDNVKYVWAIDQTGKEYKGKLERP